MIKESQFNEVKSRPSYTFVGRLMLFTADAVLLPIQRNIGESVAA